MQEMSRRRMIRISGAAAGLALLPTGRRGAAQAELVDWHGTALGAPATMQIYHPQRRVAEQLIHDAVAEMRRLELLFSLYRPDSELMRLNRHGVLAAPSAELVELMSASQHFARLSGGAFDPTVQPLWTLYVDHFSRIGANPDGPSADAVAAALAQVGHERVLVSRDRIALSGRGVQVTLNGIAQGYMADRVVDLLGARGITHTLVDMGETRCLGTHPDGRPWQVGVADPDQPGRVHETLLIENRAVATSGGYGFQFDRRGRFNHLFDPKTGASAHRYRSITVVAPTATAADALSTAFSLMSLAEIDRILSRGDADRAHLVLDDGTPLVRSHAQPKTL